MRRKITLVDQEPMMQQDEQERTPFSIEQDLETTTNDDIGNKPMDERILELVAKNPHKVYPTRLVTELGLSHEDASAELCGLMKAVGSGASFHFEHLEHGGAVMCFSFPPDFRRRARRSRAKYERSEVFWTTMAYAVKVLKIVTAFGLILSLLIVTIAGMIGLVAALVAMSRAGNSDHHRNQLMRRIRDMFYSVRQIMWCYAMFGHHFEGQDPFLSELAYDVSLVTSICCGNPSSMWFWFRAQQLSRRRTYMARSWGRLVQSETRPETGVDSGRARYDRDDEDLPFSNRLESSEHRGLLSLAVEFLFGPIPFAPGPSEMEKWKLRAAVIMEQASKDGSVTLINLSPYVDDPPDSLTDDVKIQTGGLTIVTHFHGIPKPTEDDEKHFLFPELLAESMHATTYEEGPDSDNDTWQALLYVPDVVLWTPIGRLPSSLQERRYRLTMLGSKQFLTCVTVGSLNLIGVWWLALSLYPGGVLNDFIRNATVVGLLQRTIVPVLQFYSVLFFALPAGRLMVILGFNSARDTRNRKRADLAHALGQLSLNGKQDDPTTLQVGSLG
jgi:hypothetical protein